PTFICWCIYCWIFRWFIRNDRKFKWFFIRVLICHSCLNRMIINMMLIYIFLISIFFMIGFDFFPYEIRNSVFHFIPHSFYSFLLIKYIFFYFLFYFFYIFLYI